VATVIFALMFTAVLLVAAIAIDHSRLITDKTKDQRALDSAILAASDRLGMDDQDLSGEAVAKAFYAANRTGPSKSQIDKVNLNADTGEVTGTTSTTWKATLLKGLEKWFPDVGNDRALTANSRVQKGSGSVELSLVLDNSGSMGGEHIDNLKSAADELVKTLFAGAETSQRVAVGVVPFAASVNVGAHNHNAAWIDTSASSPIHSENFSQSKSRLDLFDELGVAWKGCVEARPNGHDVTDAPAAGDAATLFVPMFAPDEPGDAGSSSLGYNNSYLDDDGGQCERYDRVCLKYSRRGKCRQWDVVRLPNDEAQARTCKYYNAKAPEGGGPNAMCTTQPILPLNSTKSAVQNAITAMQASGNTNIKEGVAWGWRVLSDVAPFTEGKPSSNGNNRKIMVLMTDGENWYNDRNTHNESVYAAHGFAAKGRLGVTYTRAGYTNFLNAETRKACDNAKADGVQIYTVAFRLEGDPVTTALLEYCSSGEDYHYSASDGGALIQSFRNIGKEIYTLRLAG